jgi:hypothetical protein
MAGVESTPPLRHPPPPIARGNAFSRCALLVKQEAAMGKAPRNLPDDAENGRHRGDEDIGEGLDNEGRPRDPDKRNANIPTPPPPD